MSRGIVVDDHLLRDLLANRPGRSLAQLVRRSDLVATTNLYYVRLCKSAATRRPRGQLLGGWTDEQRRGLMSALVVLPDEIHVEPLRELAWRVAELGSRYPISTLGAEALATAERLDATLCVWSGDDGPGIRAAAGSERIAYHSVGR